MIELLYGLPLQLNKFNTNTRAQTAANLDTLRHIYTMQVHIMSESIYSIKVVGNWAELERCLLSSTRKEMLGC